MAKRVLLSVLTIAIVASFVGLSTFALYTDSASSQGNLFQAGVLDLKADGRDYLIPMNVGVHPGNDGWMEAYRYELVSNVGSVPAGKLSFKIDNVQDFPGSYPGPEAAVESPDVGDLSANTMVRVVVYPPGPEPLSKSQLSTALFDQYFTMAELQAGITVQDTFVNNCWFELNTYVPASVGNKIMGDYTTFNGHLILEQAH